MSKCGGQISDKGFVEANGFKADLLELKKIDGAIAAKIKTPKN